MFKEVMRVAMSNTEGSLGVVIMGMDGILVERVWQDDVEAARLEAAVAEYTTLMRGARRINADSEFGELLEMTVSSEKAIFVLHSVGEDYFLAMILQSDGNFGRGRYELRRAELLLSDELTI